jgi:hypothetical protein
MPMKISLARGPRGPLSSQTAWGCLTSNLALPGTGSLLAGRAAGYGQLLLALLGLAVSLIFGVRFLMWNVSNWSRLHGPDVDSIEALGEIWVQLRWALLGLGVFLISMVWALVTSVAILASSRRVDATNKPPPLV